MVARVVRRAHALMVLGTGSGVGKSLMTAGICRSLVRRGVAVAPFKAQNMSLNSAATPDGREIGRAQALQAEAARIPARSDFNPVLLKPTSVTGSQIVLDGVMAGTLGARDFLGAAKRSLWPHVVAAYERLAREFEVIVIEGAGSPAEINLRAGDIVNMAVAHEADARCLLVADIDRGGAFAAVAGTMLLLDADDRRRIAGYAFNRFRGDVSLLDDGIRALDARLGIPNLGVVPWFDTTGLDEEDSAPRERARERAWRSDGDRLRVAVVALPHLANFTDFDALEEEPSVDLIYTGAPDRIRDADVVMLPGSKDTLADLAWLRERGIAASIAETATRAGTLVIGICAGMQMLGSRIEDPYGVESGGAADGLGLLPIHSRFERTKTTVKVRGTCEIFGPARAIDGYEIHVGVTAYDPASRPFAMLRTNDGAWERDGVVAGNAMGTYLHGVFDDDDFRHDVLVYARAHARRSAAGCFASVRTRREDRLDALGDLIDRHLALAELVPLRSVGAG